VTDLVLLYSDDPDQSPCFDIIELLELSPPSMANSAGQGAFVEVCLAVFNKGCTGENRVFKYKL